MECLDSGGGVTTCSDSRINEGIAFLRAHVGSYRSHPSSVPRLRIDSRDATREGLAALRVDGAQPSGGRKARAYDRLDDHPGVNPPEFDPTTQPQATGAVAIPAGARIRFRANFAYVKGVNRDGVFPLFRLQYAASASRWGFAIYLASTEAEGYEKAVLPTGLLAGLPEDALDCACALYVVRKPAQWSTR
jgi:hypothetical protein